jgi:hypothetical protein
MSSRGRRFVGDFPGRAMRAILLVASALLILSFSATSHAYPWMIRHGLAKCASCHTDPMGGETLTGFGRAISDRTLSTRWDKSTDPTGRSELFFGVEEPRDLRVGGSVRYMDALYKFPQGGSKGEFSQFPMQMDAYGQVRFLDRFRVSGSLGAAKVPAGSPYSTAAQITKNNAGNQLNLVSRSHWVGYDVSDAVLIRAGRLNLPFGMRIPEHVMWARSATRTDRESAQQHGVAVSYSGGAVRGEVMAILGNYQISPDKYRERGYSLYAEYLLGLKTALGVSSLVTRASADRVLTDTPANTRQAHGMTARVVPVAPLAILAEADVLLSSQTKPGYVGMVQGDYEFAQGFHALLTGEILDAGLSTVAGAVADKGAGEPKLGGWLTFGWFFFTHLDARIDLVVRQQSPTTVQSQIHWYF